MNIPSRVCGICDFELARAVLDVTEVWAALEPGLTALFGFLRAAAFISPFTGESLGVDYEIVRCDHCAKPLYARGRRGVMVLPAGMTEGRGAPLAVTIAQRWVLTCCSARCLSSVILTEPEENLRGGYPLSW